MSLIIAEILVTIALVYTIKKIKDFHDESKLTKIPEPTLKHIKKLMEKAHEPKSKTTKKSTSKSPVGATGTSRKTKRVQGGVREAVRRTKSPSRQGHAKSSTKSTKLGSRASK